MLERPSHQAEGRPPCIAAAMMVHNEQDIIDINIHHHARMGIERFFIIDNGSTDATRDKLDTLAQQYQLHILDVPEQIYLQAKWMTMLNKLAAQHGCDLVVNLDADEFYLPATENEHPAGLFTRVLQRRDSLVRVGRRNMLLGKTALQPDYRFWQAEWMVKRPVHYPTTSQLAEENLSISLASISPKVICNPRGLIRLKGGNHRAKHLLGWLNARLEERLVIAHYPFRTFAQFVYNVTHRKALLATGAGMGYHYKRWARMLERHCLKEEFSRQVFTPQKLETLRQLGIAEPFPVAKNLLSPLAEDK